MKADQCLGYELIRPKNHTWQKSSQEIPVPTRHEVWDNPLGIRVISTIENTSPSRGIEYHLSISYLNKYPPEWVENKVREDFCVKDFEKDDHGSSVMHLWQPVEKDKRGDCDCKEDGK